VLCATEIQCRLYRLTVTRFLHSVLSMPCCSGRHDVQQTQITDHVNQNSFLIYAYFLSFITDHFNSVGGAIGHNSVCLCVAVSVSSKVIVQGHRRTNVAEVVGALFSVVFVSLVKMYTGRMPAHY